MAHAPHRRAGFQGAQRGAHRADRADGGVMVPSVNDGSPLTEIAISPTPYA